MKQIKLFGKKENGELMLESLIVYTITIFLLFFILAIFSVLFQRWNIQTIANEAATRVAQTYRLTEADTVTGYIDETKLTEVREYRYLWKNSEMEDSVADKIEEYALDRLSRTTFTKNVTDPVVEVEVTKDTLARRHIMVTIKGEYAVPFGEALSYFGFSSTTKYEVTAYADCLDIIDYVNTIDYMENQTNLDRFNSETVKLINSVLKLYDNIKNNL